MDYKTQLKGPGFIRNINAANFDHIALEAFRYQYGNNSLYRSFTDALHISPAAVQRIEDIPFLPISFFKTHKVLTGTHADIPLVFESSGTTGDHVSRHHVADQALYEEALLKGFRQFYGEPSAYAIVALLPSYLERKNASLVHMASVLMRESSHAENGFYLDNQEQLQATLKALEARQQPTILLGVTFALLDFAERYPMQLTHTIVMETGGMKGRRRELPRAEVHDFLKKSVKVSQVHSEYGMTELLSQAYSQGEGIFRPSATLKVLVRDVNDPLDVRTEGTGGLNVIDLANINSCCFIATEDIGSAYEKGEFEVLGRMDNAMLRGCNLLVI